MKKICYLFSVHIFIFLTSSCLASVTTFDVDYKPANIQVHKIDTLGSILIDPKPRQHYVFFDIDGVLLSQGSSQKNADLLSSQTLESILAMQQQGVKCFALTARQPSRFLETFQSLQKFDLNFDHPNMGIDFLQEGTRYFKGIIHAPNIHKKSGVKISTKLETLQAFIEHLRSLGHEISRVSFIDNESHHFDNLQNLNFSQFVDRLDFYHYERDFSPLYSSWESYGEQLAAPDFGELKFVETLTGGSGGVEVFQDAQGKKWTLKSWKNKHHGINECLAGDLYQKTGGRFPHFYLFNDVPECIRKQIPDNQLHNGGLYRLAEFIEGSFPTQEQLTTLAAPNFTTLAFLSSWDIKPENFVVTPERHLYLIDSGGSLLHHSLGNRKNVMLHATINQEMWLQHQISEFYSLRQGATLKGATLGTNSFANIKNEDIAPQINTILANRELILKQSRDFCHSVRYENTQELMQFLESRIQHLQFLNNFLAGKINPQADPFALACHNDAAGTLIYTIKDGKPCILFCKRVRHDWWSNPGGEAEVGETLFEVAIRETGEETGDHFNFQGEIIYMPSHDLVTVDENLLLKHFRTYLAKVDYIDPQILLKKLTNSSHANEHTEFTWVSVEHILHALQTQQKIVQEDESTIRIGTDGPILYPPFFQSLQQPQIQQWLLSLVKGVEIPSTCTQSVAGHPDLEVLTTEMEETSASFARRMALWLSLAAENKSKQPENSSSCLLPHADTATASHSMLKLLYPGDPQNASTQEQIKAVVQQQSKLELEQATSPLLKLFINPKPKLEQERLQLLESIINQEKIHSDKFVVLHALRNILWFNCHALSVLWHMLNASSIQTNMLRSLQSFFARYQNANDLLDFILQEHDDHNREFKSVGLSCNPTLFSNLNKSGEATLSYFFGAINQSPPKEPWDIVKVMFDSIGLPSDVLMQELKNIYARHFDNALGAALLQIFLAPDPEVVNQACYIAGNFGSPVEDSTRKIVRQARPVLEALKANQDPQLHINASNLQVRLLADLTKFEPGTVIVKDHFCDPNIDSKKIQNELKRLFSSYLFPILTRLSNQQDVYSSKAPQILEVFRKIIGLETYEQNSYAIPKVARALENHKYSEAVRLILRNPSCLEITYTDPGSLEEITVKDLCDIGSFQNAATNLERLNSASDKLFTAIKFLCDIQSFPNEVTNLKETSAKLFLESLSKTAKEIPTCQLKQLCRATNLFIGHLEDSFEISDFFKFVRGLGPKAEQLCQFANEFREYVTRKNQIICLIKAIADINPDISSEEYDDIFSDTKQLLTSSMNGFDAAEIITTMVGLKPSDRQQVCKFLTKWLKKEHVSSYDVAKIINIIKAADNIEQFCHNTSILMTQPLDHFSLITILQTLVSIKADNRRTACQITKELSQWQDLTTFKFTKLLRVAANVTAEPQVFCQAIKLLPKEQTPNYAFVDIVELVNKISPDNPVKFCKGIVEQHRNKVDSLKFFLSKIEKELSNND